MTTLNRCLQIVKINLRHNFIPYLLLSIVIILATPLLFGLGNLDSNAVWTPLEMFASLSGIVLIVPIFIPELDHEISDVVASKYTDKGLVLLLRAAYAVAAIVALMALLCLLMASFGSDVTLLHIGGAIANSVFLGSLGALAIAVSNNIAVGYMVPLIYYATNYAGGDKLGNFYLFSGMAGSFHEKIWLVLSGLILIILAICIKRL